MPTSSVVVKCQPWFYLRLVAYSFFWLSEGGIWFTKRLVVLTAHSPPERGYGCSPSTRASEGTESSPEMNLQGNVSDQTLKLLVVSNVPRRNLLLSSKPLK